MSHQAIDQDRQSIISARQALSAQDVSQGSAVFHRVSPARGGAVVLRDDGIPGAGWYLIAVDDDAALKRTAAVRM